jgi:hypothetical protein
MSIEKFGFVYIWFDKKKKRYYIGSHWGFEDDGYICSSNWMHRAKAQRPNDFKRRIISRIYTNRLDLLDEEQRWLSMINNSELANYNSTTKKRETVKYYNLTKIAKRSWHYDEQSRLAVGEKISIAKTGKSVPCTPEKAKAISEAKKKKFAERGGMTEEHKNALKGKKKPHTEEWKTANSVRMKEQWLNGSRKKAEPKQKMSRTEQDVLCSEQLQARWSNPEWKENQRLKLKEAWIKRKQNINIQKAL